MKIEHEGDEFNKSLEISVCNGTATPDSNITIFFRQKCSPMYIATNSTASARDGKRWTHIFTFRKNSSNIISLAVRGIGVCATVYSINLYYYYCKGEHFKDINIKFPKTMSPVEGWKRVEANCPINNSSPSNHSGFCGHNGEWKINKGVGCLCERGFEQKNSSKICTRKFDSEVSM